MARTSRVVVAGLCGLPATPLRAENRDSDLCFGNPLDTYGVRRVVTSFDARIGFESVRPAPPIPI